MESDSDRETREQLTSAQEARPWRPEALAVLQERMAKVERDVEAANVMLAQFHAAHDARGRAEHEARLRLPDETLVEKLCRIIEFTDGDRDPPSAVMMWRPIVLAILAALPDAGIVAVAHRYVAACLAIRNAPYPSAEFTRACSAATDAYHALLASFGVPPPPRA